MSTTEEKPPQAAAEAAAPAPEAAAPAAEAPKETTTEEASKETSAPAPAEETKKEAEPAAPPAETKPAETKPAVEEGPIPWPVVKEDHPLAKFLAQLPEILKEADYNEVYGITLDPASPAYTKLILQKFLRANADDLAKAKEQLLATLKWRKDFQPLKERDSTFSKERFGGLGYVTILEDVPGSGKPKDVVTYNIYGAVKDNKATFGDLDGFLRWRVALMELGVEKLNLTTATEPIPDYGKGPDPYQGIQVHDYQNVSFLRMDPHAKAASKQTIQLLGRYYPETLYRKFFVNVPVVMGWIYTAMKVFVAKETQKKFTIVTSGKDLAGELGSSVPSQYGGKGSELSAMSEELNLQETKTEMNGGATKEKAKEAPKDVKEAPKEEAKEMPKEETKEAPKGDVKDAPKEEIKEAPKEQVAEASKDETKP